MMPPEAEPALIKADGVGEPVHPLSEKMRWYYEGENFIVGYFDPSERPTMESIELLGRRVSVKPEALKHLSGRTLSLHPVDVRYGWFWKKKKYVLVAV